MNPLKKLHKSGQAIWLDYIRRSLITSGELKRMVEEDAVTGVTINPTIFEKAIAGSDDYDEAITNLLKDNPHLDSRKLYESLAIGDVQMTADVLRSVYEESQGADGYVSLELSPDLARNSKGSIEEARYFWNLVDRPNLLIKVPATPEGMPVIEQLISEGINVNVTLMFSLAHYEAVSKAYLKGLEKSNDPSKVASVASFFVSRVESAVDKALLENGSPDALELMGTIAVANSKIAYRRFKEIFSGERWTRFEKKGAMVQRVLWASTGTKNPEYSDVVYVEELIGPNTVNTMPPATMNAFRDHGSVRPALEDGVEIAEKRVNNLSNLSIDLDSITEKLQVDGLEAFSQSYDNLLKSLEEKRRAILHGQEPRQTVELGKYLNPVKEQLKLWKDINFNRRLWEKDPTLWSSEETPEITNRLGWLNLPERMHERLDDLVSFSKNVKNEGIEHVVLLGMGGSSLAPWVYMKTFGRAKGYPELIVLDSTHPDAVHNVEEKINIKKSLFIVASKSGTTLEPNAFFKYFWDRTKEVVKRPGNHFIAITDPGTALEKLAIEMGFRRIFLAHSDLGGRYSALSVFGIVPAALIGVDIHRLIDRAWVAAEGCAFCVEEDKAIGLFLGATLGELALSGRDKVTFFTSPSLVGFPAWLEQLIAESTGKRGKGILPVAGEPLSDPASYGNDRFFVYFVLDGEEDSGISKKLNSLEELGHPTVRIILRDFYDIGLEIFRWEIAVTSAGAVLGINPFNQPDVELAKELARKAMKDGISSSAEVKTVFSGEVYELESVLKEWMNSVESGSYVSIHTYLNSNDQTSQALHELRGLLLKKLKVATTLGYGPRFLHSTGQLHKGGRVNGLFLQLIDEPENDLSIPRFDHSFKDIIKAQSLGDYLALKKRGQKVVRINLGKDVKGGLTKVLKAVGKN